MKKKLFIIIWNFILIIGLIWLGEFLIYKYQAKIFYNNHPKIHPINQYTYTVMYPDYMIDLKNYYNGLNNIFFGRKPDGLEYKNQNPITVFGCSFAFGQYLNYDQTFSYKLAHKLKRPVHNRAISGGSFQHMYMQTVNNSFYEDIPESDTVIYVMIGDHYRRVLLNYFDILDYHRQPHYTKIGKMLIEDNYNNKLLSFINSLYTVKALNHLYANWRVSNEIFKNKITDDAVFYFTESRDNLKKHWNKDFKYIIILYEDWDIAYKELLIEKLKQNGFIVFSTKELTEENLKDEKYEMQENHHPTEAAWDLLTPKIIEKLGL